MAGDSSIVRNVAGEREILVRVASENKPKVFETGRDMILSIGVIVVAMFAVVGATGLCTINPEDSQQGPVREVDARSFLDLEARSTGIAIRIPEVPEGWYTNSARRQSLAGELASTVGFVSPNDGYVSATQTNVGLPEAAKQFDGNFRPDERTVDVEGVEATVYSSEDEEVRPVWAADLGDVRLVLSGSASEADFTTVLESFIDAPVADGVGSAPEGGVGASTQSSQ
ncbi:hypothetical protein CENDO_04195 [Corynebacterium endometrii]|uniref:DUF4245 domain-containing protein n=1 Tax=Corynebacterium endometrii TaxID=2488819 RepID=A0A4P7QFG1_9CORY|nr:hypothetical protein CENDO_04195 [Corynebacterium endometrii]